MTDEISVVFANGDYIKYDIVFEDTSNIGVRRISLRNPRPLDQCGFWGHDLTGGLSVDETDFSSKAWCRECKNVIVNGEVFHG